MGIEPGGAWGRAVVSPSRLTVLGGDRELSEQMPAGPATSEIGATLRTGNLWRSMGGPRPATAGAAAIAVSVDAVEVTSSGRGTMVAADSVTVRRRMWRGGALAGRVVVASNSGLRRDRVLLPRAHPGDGEWDVLRIDASMGLKARLMAWRRARRGDHLPHPSMSTGRFDRLVVEMGRGEVLVLDGVRVRLGRRGATVHLAVLPDRWTLHFASPTV